MFDCLTIYALKGMLMHSEAREHIKVHGSPVAFGCPESRALAVALVTGKWENVERMIGKGTCRTRMGALLSAVDRCTCPGDDVDWAVHLVKTISADREPLIEAEIVRAQAAVIEASFYRKRKTSMQKERTAAQQLRWIADAMESGAETPERLERLRREAEGMLYRENGK